MEKENYSEIILEAMRLAGDFALTRENVFLKDYVENWEKVFNELANKAIEFSKKLDTKN